VGVEGNVIWLRSFLHPVKKSVDKIKKINNLQSGFESIFCAYLFKQTDKLKPALQIQIIKSEHRQDRICPDASNAFLYDVLYPVGYAGQSKEDFLFFGHGC